MPVWALKLPAFAWGILKRHPLAVILMLVLLGQQMQLWQSRRENTALRQTIETQKAEMASLRSAIQKLTDAAAILKPGETKTIYVDRPVTIPGPTQIVEKQVPVIVTRTEHTIETKVQTVSLPPKEIERIIRESPQSLIFDLTATRDIKAGEKFRVVAAQVQPGIWQPILELGAPITADVRTVTPIERIPQIPVAPRFSFSAYAGYGSLDQWFTGLRVSYRLMPHLTLEGQGEHRWRANVQDYRLSVLWTF